MSKKVKESERMDRVFIEEAEKNKEGRIREIKEGLRKGEKRRGGERKARRREV